MASYVNFAVVGCSKIAGQHGAALQRISSARLRYACDILTDRAQAFAETYNAERITADYDQVLADADVDAVCLVTPNGLHAEMTRAAIEAGKHVVVEKPLALDSAVAAELVHKARQRGVVLSTVLQKRLESPFVEAQRAVANGALGRICMAGLQLWWNRSDEYFGEVAWRGTRAMDGGLLYNQAIHYIDLLQWIAGPVAAVHARKATLLRRIETEDNVVATLRFQNGALGVIGASVTVYPRNFEGRLEIFGEKGTFVVGGKKFDSALAWDFADDLLAPGTFLQSPAGNPERKPLRQDVGDHPPGSGHYLLLKGVTDAILHGGEPPVTGEDGLDSLNLIHAIHKSAESGEEVLIGFSGSE